MFSDPVVGLRFFGRSKSIELLVKRANALKDGYRQNIAILGPKLIGKSSLVLHFLAGFEQPQVIPVYIDLKANSFHHFVYKFMGGLLFHYLKNKKIEVGVELESLKKSAQQFIPQTVAAIQVIEQTMRNGQLTQSYEQLLALTAVLKRESGVCSIVIFDDFDLLARHKVQTPFSGLAREIMVQKDTMYVLISSQVSYAKKILANQLSLLFGNFECLILEPFDYATCCNFLAQRFPEHHLPAEFRDFLIAFSEGHPFYLDILSNKVLGKARQLDQKEISARLISQAFNCALYDSQGILNQYFTTHLTHNLNGADYANFIPILLSAAEQATQLNQLSLNTRCKPRMLSKQVDYLTNRDLLNKIGVFFRIEDKMFRFWLKSVYHRKSQSLTADPSSESEQFSQEIEQQLLAFAQEQQKGLTQRIIELFKSFDNEIVAVQNKAYKFWRFAQVDKWVKPDLSDCLIARYPGGCWICLVSRQQISDKQLIKLLDYCKKFKQKIRKIIVVSLKELDLNVRLTALEKRIWIWTLADLNLLFDLYGKQKVFK